MLSATGVLIISWLILPVFEHLPLAVLAASNFVVGLNMLDLWKLVALYKFDSRGFFLAILTIVIFIGLGAEYALILPSFLALLMFSRSLKLGHGELYMYRLKTADSAYPFKVHSPAQRRPTEGVAVSLRNLDKIDGLTDATFESTFGVSWLPDTLVYRIAGQVCYINWEAHIERLKSIAVPYKALIISCINCFYIDMDGIVEFGRVIEALQKAGGDDAEQKKLILMSSVNEPIRPILRKAQWFSQMESEGRVSDSDYLALVKCKQLMGEPHQINLVSSYSDIESMSSR